MQVPKGTLLWEACKEHGIDIPIFCYHTKLGPVGACRTCLVEVEGQTKGPITACSTPVADNMVVRTRSPVVEKAQRGIFEFLLANHPLDCPICDRGGECPLQDQTFAYGPGTSRYIEPKRHHVKPIALGPTVALDRERCVLCWRCVRFCAEVAEDASIVLLDRGEHTVVGTFHDEPYVSNFSGNVIELCPVGALTSRKQRFNFRPWELRNRPSVCPHCAMGCNINISVRKNDEVIRFLSRDNPHVDDSWLCDRGRFNFEFINSPERLASPLIRRDGAFHQVSWTEALEFIADKVQPILAESAEAGGENPVAGIASPRLTNEDLFVFKRFMRQCIGTGKVDHFPRPQFGPGGDIEDAMRRLERRLAPIDNLDRSKTILLLGADPSAREPVMELRIRLAINRHGARLVVLSPEEITLSGKADQALTYPRERFAEYVRSLVSALTESSTQGATGEGKAAKGKVHPDGDPEGHPEGTRLRNLVSTYLREGPITVLYDDAFDGVADTAEALQAVADLVDTLGNTQAGSAGGVPGEVGVIPMLDDCNSMGARELRVLPASATADASWAASAVSDLLGSDSRVRVAFLLGVNLVRDLPGPSTVQRLQDLDLLVVHELMMTETAALADVVLPAASFAEKIGTFTNTEGRVQALATAVPSPGIARADWQILVDLSQYFDTPLDYGLPQDIWNDMQASVDRYAGVGHDDLGTQGVLTSALQRV